MVSRQHQSRDAVFRTGLVGRVATILLAAALFIAVFALAALVAAVAAAAGLVVWARLWWSNRCKVADNRAAGNSEHVTLEGDYRVLPSGRTDKP
jgi:hypothetical protein